MIVSAIAAMAKNRVIGKEGGLPWRLPEDFKFFKDTTMGHIMVMGRKTFESLGKPLPGRLHVVISRQPGYHPAGAYVFSSVESALEFCKRQTGEDGETGQTAKWGDEVFIIGGGEIYQAALPWTDRIYLTEISQDFPGDAKFPEFDKRIYREVSRRQGREAIPYDFVVYERSR